MIKIAYLSLGIFLTTYYFFAPESMSKEVMAALLILVMVILVSFFLKKEKEETLRGQYIKHSTLCLLGFIIVHFQLYVDYIIGNISDSYWFVWVNHNIVIKSFVLSLIGLLAFILGYLMYKRKTTNAIKLNYTSISIKNTESIKPLQWIATVLLGGYFLTVNPMYLMGYYGAERIGAEAAYLILAFRVVFFAIIIQSCRNMAIENKIPKSFKQYIKQHGVHSLSLLIIYLLSVLMSGDRGPLITYSLCFLSGYLFLTKKKVSAKYALILISIGAISISLLGTIRSLDRSKDLVSRLKESIEAEGRFQEISFLPQTQDLATSVRALHATVNYVPGQHDYMYGRFQFQQLAVAIPFFSIFNNILFDDHHYKYGGSTRFVTWINQGDFPYSGDGTTCVADFYFDFGLVGVMIGMFVFGYFMRYAEITMYALVLPSLFAHAFFVGYLSSAIYIARSSFLIEMKAVVWIFLILIANKYFLSRVFK